MGICSTDASARDRRRGARALALVALGALWPMREVHAVPSFARQTGLECVVCHVSWPELTSTGRQFKLGGYTLSQPAKPDEQRPLVSFSEEGPAPQVPLAAFLQAAVTHTARTHTDGTDSSSFPRQDALALQQASLFLAGRLGEHAGGFVQWSYDGVAHHSAIDNVDLRIAHRYESHKLQLLYGLSLNNNPTVSDVYNSTPVWGFPFAGSSVAATPAASTLIQEGLAQQVAGLTAYTLLNGALYAELGGYRTADGAFSVLRAGVDRSTAAVLDGTAPYWRLAFQREWNEGAQSAMFGAFGLSARKFPDPLHAQGPADRFRDTGVDAQYQYVTDAHRFSTQVSYIREHQTLDGSVAAGAASNGSNRLDSLNAKVTYYYQRKYGITLGYQRIHGDSDSGLYDTGEPVSGSINGSPDSAAYVIELNWLPWRDRRITVQYTDYAKFNGASGNYDGFGRSARDNNTLMLMLWLAF